MRATLRLLASVKPGRFLEAGNPTGLTGLFTHPSPRSTLLFLYGSILDKLKILPENSVYRQSTEALTKHRMKIMESIKPAGYDEWAQRASAKLQAHPELFKPGMSSSTYGEAGGQAFVEVQPGNDSEDQEWDGEKGAATLEGTRNQEDGSKNANMMRQKKPDINTVQWEPEPPLEATQINDAEAQIGAGLIEEVIQVAEGELKLVDTMVESKVWEELEEKPEPGQWDYFTRDQHTPGTQEPPKY